MYKAAFSSWNAVKNMIYDHMRKWSNQWKDTYRNNMGKYFAEYDIGK